ncbi:FAD-dependent oxidoreductase, partial [Burkholderia pseudomallei]|uniref:FAD-dependent oxidoreductase n=1 Tax=Burkholderia pseudomallei TaxID=28450 RepID=UPI0029325F95
MTNEILTVDVAIVGAGPAGLAAARAAARSGCTVAIVDDNPRAGGQVWRHGPHAAPGALARASLGVLRQPNVRHLAATRVVAAPRPGAAGGRGRARAGRGGGAVADIWGGGA